MELATMLQVYETMTLIRAADERVRTGLAQGQFAFNYYPVLGQEVIPAAIAPHLQPDDYMITTYRGLHDAIGKGVPVGEVLAEMLGRSTGTSKGKGGAMHLSDPSSGLMVTTGIVGAGLPIACGLGTASRVRGDDRVTVVNFGDGSTSIGAFHEALNIAGLWSLPVVFVCQNNRWAEYTKFGGFTRVDKLSVRAQGYGIVGLTADGNDPESVYEVAGEAIRRARSGEGPTLLELQTYRLLGHTFGGGTDGMDQEELAQMTEREPVGACRATLLARGVPEAALAEIEARSLAAVEEAMVAALAAEPPSDDELFTDVVGVPGGVTSTETPGAIEKMTMSKAINLALRQAMTDDERVILLGEDIIDPLGGVFKCTHGLSTEFGLERVRNTPIAEQAIVGSAVGAALAGLRPVAEIMLMDFLAVCLDQLVNHAAKLRYMSGGRTSVPMVLRTAVIAGTQSAAQHSQSLEAWLAHVPGLRIAIPSTPADAKGMLASCIEDDDPCVFVESAPVLYAPGDVPVDSSFRVPIGVASVERTGADVTIVSYGWMMREVRAATETLVADGIDVEVVDLRWIAPLDMATVLESVRRTKRAVVVHAATEFGGIGAEISAQISTELWGVLAAPVERLGGAECPTPFAKNLEKQMYPTASTIVVAVRKVVGR